MTFLVEYSVEIDLEGEPVRGPQDFLSRFLQEIGNSSRPVPSSPHGHKAAHDATVTEWADIREEDEAYIIEYELTLEAGQELHTEAEEALKSQLVEWIRQETAKTSFGSGPLEVTESWNAHSEW
ncbi:hypothetical protein [Salinibacter ruber]|uniref:Uncharacterized protein n=1 Tax=Salinibacter ruber TaxID=146919 RepID=A0AAW5P7B4_9BACT|nr:hypothetical protein [Salinibacter ruber]MCS4157805.1 hypothetical protein [Salinibacter ruber]